MATVPPPYLPASTKKPQSLQVPGWLFLVFFLSGISGLLYEVVWIRMLGCMLGNTAYATSTVLAAFMGGLAIGSFLAGRFIDKVHRPLVWYALLELGIGLSALLSLALPDKLMPVYRSIYQLAGESRAWLTAGQVLIAAPVLLLPTALMGATLPTLSSFGARSQKSFGRYVGALYALNTLGAVVGVIASGFVTIGEIGETNTLLFGAGINGLVAIGVFVLGCWKVPQSDATYLPAAEYTSLTDRFVLYPAFTRRIVVSSFALSGFVSLALEVIWSRMLLLYLGNTIYAFSSMLAVMMACMGIGSLVGSRLVDRLQDSLWALARLELLVGLVGAAALVLFPLPIFDSLPNIVGKLVVPIVLLGPLGLLWGIIFPIATHCYTRSRDVAGKNVGELYAWNTIGCIAGSLASGFVMIPCMGVSHSVAILAAVSILLGLILLAFHPDGFLQKTRALDWGLIGASAFLLVLIGDPYYHLIHRRMKLYYRDDLEVFKHIEDATATTTAFGSRNGGQDTKNLWINGIGMTWLTPVTKEMAHLPIMLADSPHEVLIICFGMGTSVRSASRYDNIQVTTVELVPGVVDCFSYYHPDGPELLRDPRVKTIVDDGRNYLLMQTKRYDVIALDPAPPIHSAGTVNLYSREFFKLCHDRLQPRGVMCLWIPPANQSEVKMIMRTFMNEFPEVSIWSGPKSHPGIILLGTQIHLQQIPQKIRQGYSKAAVVNDLNEWGTDFDTPEKLLELYVADKQQMKEFLAGVREITDDRPYTEFPFWRALFQREEFTLILTGPMLRKHVKPLRSPNNTALASPNCAISCRLPSTRSPAAKGIINPLWCSTCSQWPWCSSATGRGPRP